MGMGTSNGFRRKTRKLFKKDFKTRGMPSFASIAHQFTVGDYVDCKINPAVQKGMPHKIYHGKTGRVLVVNVRSYVILFFLKVGGKVLRKTITIRNEHLKKSRCDEEYRRRFELNYLAKVEAEKEGRVFVPLRREIEGARPEIVLQLAGNQPIELKNKAFSKVQ